MNRADSGVFWNAYKEKKRERYKRTALLPGMIFRFAGKRKSPSGAVVKDKNKPKKKPAPIHERELQ